MLDIHYSDTWADPGHQDTPAAWRDLDAAAMEKQVEEYTRDVISQFRAAGAMPDMVQIGNEINGGMLWPDGSTSNWNNLAALLKQGYNAVKACSSATLVMLHLAEGGDNAEMRAWFDQARSRGVPFDVIGVSHYVYWHGSLASLQTNLNDLSARYDKDVVVAEMAYGFTLAAKDSEPNIFNSSLQQAGGYPATPQGQSDLVRDTLNVVKAVPGGHGLGVFYWEPAWTAVAGSGWDPTNPSSGNGWENQALFDYNDRALAPGLTALGGELAHHADLAGTFLTDIR